MTDLMVIKRDGRVVPFDRDRIERAVLKCENQTHPELMPSIRRINAQSVTKATVETIEYQGRTTISVEDIQNIVEDVMMGTGLRDSAKVYILYRAEHARLRDERPIPDDVKAAFAESAKYFKQPSQELVYYLNYARWSEEKGRRETWVETVDRAVDYLYELGGDRLDSVAYRRIRQGILDMKAMPSMRLLAMAGAPARRDNVAIYNCSAMGVSCIDAFVEALLISMAGCGVGFSVERQFVDQLPRIATQRGGTRRGMMVDDSSLGWADALRTGLECWFAGDDVEFDLSLIRPSGAPLKVKGGRASGPAPLRAMLSKIRAKILSRQGGHLTTLDAHDLMCWVGDAAVMGGMRRTAMISLFDPDDEAMRLSKAAGFETENAQRWNANNSAVISDTMTQEQFASQFMEMVRSGNGEPGIFNRQVSNVLKPERRQEYPFLTNPCLHGDTKMLTQRGLIPIAKLANSGETIPFMTPSGWRDGYAWKTGTKEVVLVKLSNGQQITLTPDHRIRVGDIWKESGKTLGDTVVPFTANGDWEGEAILSDINLEKLGFIQGDGSFRQDCDAMVVNLGKDDDDVDGMFGEYIHHGARTRYVPSGDTLVMQIEQMGMSRTVLPERTLPAHIWTLPPDRVAAFLRGLFSANGSVQPKYRRIALKGTCRKAMGEVQILLAALGMRTYITTNQPYKIEWHNGPYTSRMSYDLNLAAESIGVFHDKINFLQNYKREALNLIESPSRIGRKTYPTVVAIEPAGFADVYDFRVDDESHAGWANGIQVHNCSEILLRDTQFCNLSIIVAREDDTLETLTEKTELATAIGTIQSLATNFPNLRSSWKTNCEEERLLGVDITGQYDCPAVRDPETLRHLKQVAVEANQIISAHLGTNQSSAVTCVKPSGNSAQLLDTSSGVHPRYSAYYIRRYRVATTSPLYRVLKDAGVPLSPENGQTIDEAVTWVASFPIASPEGAITSNDITALEHCEHWLMVRRNYTEHKPSATIYYGPDEIIDLMKWVWDHRAEVDGITFLPRYDARLDQAPYEEISKAEYERRTAEFPEIDFSKLVRFEKDDRTTASQEIACSAGVCETI